jgi:sarcosine oxidase, subunit alpha
MSRNRLEGKLPPELSRPLIDRAAPISFRLNGITIDGFAGDTVLSAALASGIDTAGLHLGHPIALDAGFAPPVIFSGNGARRDLAVPMALCPASHGMDLATRGPRHGVSPVKRVGALFSGAPRSLECDFDGRWQWPGPWIDAAASQHHTADLVIIGGGVAGLSAALVAAHRGARVTIIERSQRLGGLSEYFGKTEGEPQPDSTIAGLIKEITSAEEVTILTGTEAFAIRGDAVRAIGVRIDGSVPAPVHYAITARKIILATGCAERLPIFPGNRLPGVVRAAEAWRLAAHHNVWPQGKALVHTSVNVAYRMALLGSDSNRPVLRSTDPRPNPQTRFIEFSKAYGFRLGWGTMLAGAAPARNGGLDISQRDTETAIVHEAPLHADRLIFSGGWQPELGLWLGAGGEIGWDRPRQCFAARGTHPKIELAGAVAGYQSLRGCAVSGAAMARRIFDGTEEDIPDPMIDEMFETRDGPLTCARPQADHDAPTYLAPSQALMTMPAQIEKPLWQRLLTRAGKEIDSVHDEGRALSLPDIAGAVVAGALDPEAAIEHARERCVLPERFMADPEAAPLHWPSEHVPAYLKGRFGHAALWTLVASVGRRFEPGCLVFANSDDTDPTSAIGVVLSIRDDVHQVLLDRKAAQNGRWVFVRDGSTSHAAPLDHRVD